MPKRRDKQTSKDSNGEEGQRVFAAVLLLCAGIFFVGRSCGENRVENRVEALQERVRAIDKRVAAIEYPEGEKKYFWPEGMTGRNGDEGKQHK